MMISNTAVVAQSSPVAYKCLESIYFHYAKSLFDPIKLRIRSDIGSGLVLRNSRSDIALSWSLDPTMYMYTL